VRARLFLFTGQSIDAATFALFFLVTPSWIMARLVAPEQNGVHGALMALGGFMAIVVFKIGFVSLALLADHRFAYQSRLVVGLMIAGGLSGLIGALFNAAAIYDVVVAL
jgi:hypothetical protein